MRWDGDEPETGTEADGGKPRRQGWRALRGGGAPDHAAAVRLRREFKGVTVAELLLQDELLAQLPGRARSTLAAVRRGDLARAEAELPGTFTAAGEPWARIVAGPGHGRQQRAARLRLLVFVLATGMLAALLLVFG